MYLLKILGLLAVSAWVILSTHRRLTQGRFARAWRVWFLLLACVGLGLGIWFLCIRRMASPTERAWGVPFVIAGGLFSDGRWHDGGVGRFLYFALLADVCCAVALCLLPLAIASRIVHNSGSADDKSD